MNKYNDLEVSILSILLQKPNLMNNLIIDEKYFIKNKKIWLFMKSFYKRFGNFDLNLMYSVCKNKYHLVSNIEQLALSEPCPSLFEEYQKQLMKEYDELKKDKWIREKVYELANNYYMMNLSLEDFKKEINNIELKANKIFKDDN